MASLAALIFGICLLNSIQPYSTQNLLADSKDVIKSLALLSKQTQPFLTEACQYFGFNASAEMNLAKVDRSEVANNTIFRALLLLRQTGCSRFITPFTCAIFDPQVRAMYGAAIPPCRSVCESITRSCVAMLKIAASFFPFPQGPCKLTTRGRLFRGKVRKTKTGIPCQNWSAQSPHKHWITARTHPNEGLSENYCRNPDNEPEGPWCYTTRRTKRWEYCHVPMCKTSLRCHMFPKDGCVDFTYNKKSDSVEAKVKGSPKKSDFSRFIKFTSFESIAKWLQFLK